MSRQAAVLVLMGVDGCGKTTLAAALAATRPAVCLEERTLLGGCEAVAHEAAGTGRRLAARNGPHDGPAAEPTAPPELLRARHLAEALATARDGAHAPLLLLCTTALRRAQRTLLRIAVPGLRFVYLEIDVHSAARRLQAGRGRSVPPRAIAAQFARLESPGGEPDVLVLPALHPAPELVRQVTEWLGEPALT